MCNNCSDVVKMNQENEHSGCFWHGVVMSDPDACVLVVDDQGVVCAINDAGAAFFGMSDPEEVLGKRPFDLIPQEAATERVAILNRVLSTGNQMIVHEMWNGVRARTQVFPMAPTADGQQRALVIIRGAAQLSGHEESRERLAGDFDVFNAKHLDLGPLKALTEREIEVLGLIGRGLTTAQIAKRIHRSVKTVEWHRASLGDKLKAKNRVQLAAMAIKAGLVDENPEKPTSSFNN